MKAIFFNAKGILYNRLDPHQHLRAFLESVGLEAPPPERLKRIGLEVKDQTKRGRLIPEVYSSTLLKACGLTNPGYFMEGEKAIERDRANIFILPGVPETLNELKSRGFKLGIITDSSAPREQKVGWMRDRGVQVEWDAYANSRDVHAMKPDLPMYQVALQQAGVEPAESAFVGWRQMELLGAKRLGMVTIAVNYEPATDADYYLEKFEDILGLPFFQTVV